MPVPVNHLSHVVPNQVPPPPQPFCCLFQSTTSCGCGPGVPLIACSSQPHHVCRCRRPFCCLFYQSHHVVPDQVSLLVPTVWPMPCYMGPQWKLFFFSFPVSQTFPGSQKENLYWGRENCNTHHYFQLRFMLRGSFEWFFFLFPFFEYWEWFFFSSHLSSKVISFFSSFISRSYFCYMKWLLLFLSRLLSEAIVFSSLFWMTIDDSSTASTWRRRRYTGGNASEGMWQHLSSSFFIRGSTVSLFSHPTH